MGRVKLNTFAGMAPAVDDRLLPDNAAAHAVNCWLFSGALVGLPITELLRTNGDPNTSMVYRIPADYGTGTNPYGESTWMEFENGDTDVVRAPVFGDTYDRYYWASSALPPKYNTLARIQNSDPEFLLGVPTPTTAPSCVASGGSSGIMESRAYVVTFVSAYGEESAPGVPALEDGQSDDTWALTSIPVPGGAATDRNLTKKRIYRTVTAVGGAATFFFVAEIDIAVTTYNDTISSDVVASNEILQSYAWTPPPSDLQGFIQMPNGVLAGWRENEVWFSEPYRPHAWPSTYVLTVEYPIVGLGLVNQTLIVCTAGYPVALSGVHPSAMAQSTFTMFEPCVSRSSILSTPEGVYYASPNGLVLVSSARADNVTRKIITADKWQLLTRDTKLRAVRLGTAYFAYGTVQHGVFNDDAFEPTAFAQEDYTGAKLGVLIDPQQQLSVFSMLESDSPIFGVHNDPWSGEVFVISDGETRWLNLANLDRVIGPCVWRSKIFQFPYKTNMGVMRVYFEVPDNSPVLDPVRDNTLDQTLDADQYGLVRVYFDGVHTQTWDLRESGELWKLKSGFKADFMQVEVETRVKILNIQIASSAKELRQI